LEGLPWEPGGREPPCPRDRPIQRPMPRPGLRLREIRDGDGQLATGLPGDGEQPGQLGRTEARTSRAERDAQSFGDLVEAPSGRPSEPGTEEPIGHRDMEAGPGEPTGRCDPGVGDRPLDERISLAMPGRPSPTRETPEHLRRESESVQIPDINLGSEGRSHSI